MKDKRYLLKALANFGMMLLVTGTCIAVFTVIFFCPQLVSKAAQIILSLAVAFLLGALSQRVPLLILNHRIQREVEALKAEAVKAKKGKKAAEYRLAQAEARAAELERILSQHRWSSFLRETTDTGSEENDSLDGENSSEDPEDME